MPPVGLRPQLGWVWPLPVIPLDTLITFSHTHSLKAGPAVREVILAIKGLGQKERKMPSLISFKSATVTLGCF